MSLAVPPLNKLTFRAQNQFFLTSGATLIVALALGLSSTLAHDGFGQHDLIPFAIYSLPFALLTGLAAGLIFKLTRRWPVWLATSSAFLVGLVFGYFAPFAVLLSMGFLFGTMSIGIWQHWCVTAALVCSATVVLKRIGLAKRGARALVGLTLLSGGLWFGFVPLLSLFGDDQELTICFFQHHPGHAVLRLKRSATDLFAADLGIAYLQTREDAPTLERV